MRNTILTILLFAVVCASGAGYTNLNGADTIYVSLWQLYVKPGDTVWVSTYYTGDDDSLVLISDSAGVSPVIEADTFSFAPADEDSSTIAIASLSQLTEIFITTTGAVEFTVNDSSSPKIYLGADMVYRIPRPENRIRKFDFTSIDSARVIVTYLNSRFDE